MIFTKLIFLSLLFNILTNSALACSNIDENTKEAVVMYDMNFVLAEVEAAKSAACKKGQKFILLPYGYEKHKEMGLTREKLHRMRRKAFKNYEYGQSNSVLEDYTKASDAFDVKLRSLKKINSIDFTGKRDAYDSFVGGVDLLASEGIKIKSLVLSGHDGSGHLYGKAGDVYKDSVVKQLYKSYKGKEDLLGELSSVYLWGCYTTTLDETSDWKELLPGLKLLAGFNGSGPSIGKLASNTVLHDMLMKEEQFYYTETMDNLKDLIEGVENLKYTLPGVYVRNCLGDEYHYAKSRVSSTEYRVKFQEVVDYSVECNKKDYIAKYNEVSEEFKAYYHGEKEIPKNTATGPLRQIYDFVRQNEHCNEFIKNKSILLDSNKVGLLLFFKGVKGNFFNSFGHLFAEVESILEEVPVSEEQYLAQEDSKIIKLMNKYLKSENKKMMHDIDLNKDTKESLIEILKDFPRTKEEFVETPRLKLLELNQKLSRESSRFMNIQKPNVHQVSYRKKILSLNKALQIYMYGLHSRSCTPLGQWHEDHGAYLYQPRYMSDSSECRIE